MDDRKFEAISRKQGNDIESQEETKFEGMNLKERT